MPRVYGNWPGISSGRAGRSPDVYSGLTGTPEMVEVSMPSSRLVWLESNSSCQICLGSLVRIFTAVLSPLCEVFQDPLRDFVRSAVAFEPLDQLAVLVQRRPRPLPGELRHHLCGLVPEPFLRL